MGGRVRARTPVECRCRPEGRPPLAHGAESPRTEVPIRAPDRPLRVGHYGPVVGARLCAAALFVGCLSAACSHGSAASPEARISKAYQALTSRAGPKQTGTAASDAALQSMVVAGKPTDPRFAVIQQDALQPRSLTPSDVAYLYGQCGKLGVPVTPTGTFHSQEPQVGHP